MTALVPTWRCCRCRPTPPTCGARGKWPPRSDLGRGSLGNLLTPLTPSVNSRDDAVHVVLGGAAVVSDPRSLDRRVEDPFLLG